MTDEEPLSDYEKLRLKNIEENRKMMIELGILRTDSTSNIRSPTPVRRSRPPLKRLKRLSEKDTPRRRSKRLSSATNHPVTFTDEVSSTIIGHSGPCQVALHSDSEDEENCVTLSRRRPVRRSSVPRRSSNCDGNRYIIPVEEITQEQLESIVTQSSLKVYSQDGTTCHQCRQKTLDQKSVCRSRSCVGVRGQFCGICLPLRYGEKVDTVLLDPEWICPPCRGICNCSICRSNENKPPTGQLALYAIQRGFKSVRHFLEKEEMD